MSRSLSSIGIRFSIVVAAAVCLVVALLILDRSPRVHFSDAGKAKLFQHAVGGLGMGAAAVPAWNILHYDPRLQPVDDSNLWPIAGSYPYSPSAVSSVVNFREMAREDLRIIKVEQ